MAITIDKNLLDKQQAINERVWRNNELVRAGVELNKVLDSDASAVGTETEWRQYRNALRSWPESLGFPETAHRPIAPDAE